MWVRQIVPMVRAKGDALVPGTIWECLDVEEALRLAAAGVVELLDPPPPRQPDPASARQAVDVSDGGISAETTSQRPPRRRGRQ